MADNVPITSGAGTIIKTQEVQGKHFQEVLVHMSDSTTVDSFGRLRVSAPQTIFDSKLLFDKQPEFWDETAGAGTTSAHAVNTASVTFTSTLNTADTFTRQTFMRFNYQPGKSIQIFMTGVLDKSGGGTGVQRRLGPFDDENGLFFEDDEGTTKVVKRSFVTGSAVDTKIAQSSWNIDKMDGTGPSGFTIDWTKAQIFSIDFEWLSVGRVRFALGLRGKFFVVHEMLHSNVETTAYMSTPNLPLRYEMITTGSSPASTFECICSTVMIEGGRTANGKTRHVSTAGTHIDADVDGTLYAIIGIRLKTTHIDAEVRMLAASLSELQGSNNLEWLLMRSPTVAGTFTYGDLDANSAVQVATGATANVVTNGVSMGGGHFSSAQKGGSGGTALGSAIRLGAAIDGTRDTVVLCVRPVGSTMTDIEGSLTWRETP